MGGNTLGEQMLFQERNGEQPKQVVANEAALEASRNLLFNSQVMNGNVIGPGHPEYGNTDAAKGPQTPTEDIGALTRYGTVYGKGLLRTPEGVVNTLGYYWDNPGEAGGKALFAGSIGVGMRTLLPKAGAARGVVGAVMLGMFAIDGVSALVNGGKDAANAKNRQELDQAATRFGDKMGMFTLDAVAGGYIGFKAERLTGKVFENPVGLAQKAGGLADMAASKFGKPTAADAPTFSTRFGNYTEQNVAPRMAAWEKKVDHFWTSDESRVGKFLNTQVAKLDTFTAKFKTTEKPQEGHILDSLTKEQKLGLMKDAQRQHAAAIDSHMMYRHGLKGEDGQYHGFDRTLALLKKGLNPEQIKAADEIPNVPDIKDVRLDAALKGLRDTRDQMIGLNDQMTKISGHDHHGPHDHGHQFKKDEGGVGAPKPHAEPGSHAKANEGAGALQVKTDGEINATMMQKIAAVTEEERLAYTQERTIVESYKDEKIGQVHNAVNQNPKPLGEEHIPARNSMVKLGDEVETINDVKQVKDLFDFFAAATTQDQAAGLGAHQRLAKELNLVGQEFHTHLVDSMRAAGIKDPFTILQGKTPPLFAVASDLVTMENGTTVNAGPYTMRRIITQDPKTGENVTVWGPDLVKYPLNMYGERASSIGVYGHEIGHDWNGLIAKFLDKSGEGGVLTNSVKKALGDKYGETATIVAKDGTKKELVVNGEKWTNGRLIEDYLRATRDENTSDIIGTAWTGINMPLALARLLMSGRRNGNLMENSNVFSPSKMSNPDNPMGFEVHAIDALRMVIGAKTIEYLGKGNPALEAQAKSLIALSREGSTKGEYELYNLDKPGQKIVIERDVMDNVIAELITAQMETPLSVLEGKTFSSILPPLKDNWPKMEKLSDLMTDAIVSGKKVTDVVGDPLQFKQDYTITQVFGSGLPAELKLVNKGMDPVKAHEAVNAMSDHMRGLYLEGDPHVHSLVGPKTEGFLPQMKERVVAARTSVQRGAVDLVGRQTEMRWWASRNAAMLSAGAGTALLPDGDMSMPKRLKSQINASELMAAEQQRKAMLEGKR
ncbi:MAG: hypothetical protein IAF58_14885 [Leptolyngbya sp.]|nr:hypothetical protein [Candidatus Melainabacteria bacterium]